MRPFTWHMTVALQPPNSTEIRLVLTAMDEEDGCVDFKSTAAVSQSASHLGCRPGGKRLNSQ